MKKSSSRILTYITTVVLTIIVILGVKINNAFILEELCVEGNLDVSFSPFSFSQKSTDASVPFLNTISRTESATCFVNDTVAHETEKSPCDNNGDVYQMKKSPIADDTGVNDATECSVKKSSFANRRKNEQVHTILDTRDRKMLSRKSASTVKYITSEEQAEALGLSTDYVDFYAISDADELFAFAEIAKNDPQTSAVLLCDITVNEDLFERKLTLDPQTLEPTVKSGIDVRAWTPILEFGGVFDGGGHAISGIFVKSESDNVGFFSVILSTGTVKNLEITASCIYSSSKSVGTVAGKNIGAISSVSVSNSVISSCSDFAGGIVGSNEGEICAASFCGKVNAKMYAGGIAGDNSGSVTASIVLSSDVDFINAEQYVGAIAGRSNGSVSCCYSIAKVSGSEQVHPVIGDRGYGSVIRSVFVLSDDLDDTEPDVDLADENRFASGEICYLLNSEGNYFYQTVGVGYPSHYGMTVYKNHTYDCPGDTDGEAFYSNEQGDVIKNPDHSYISDCDKKCEYCNFERKAPKMHTFVDDCDGLCDLCGQAREAPHNYYNSCDDICNDCGAKRDASHKYSGDCDAECNECGYIREAVPHKFSYPCDTVCDECGAIRTIISHTFTDACDGECNYCDATRIPPHCFVGDCDTTCNLCGYQRIGGEHTYDSECDAECNVCKEERTPPHSFSSDCDEICDQCDHRRASLSDHVYDASCDSECNACGHRRTAADHSYISPCAAVCTECGYVRTPPSSHTFLGGCLDGCSLCGAEPENASHTYDDDCDTDCNICGEMRKTQGHIFGEWHIALEPTLTEFGINVRSCSICGRTESETTEPLIYDAKYIALFSLGGLAFLAVIVLLIKLIIDKVYSRQVYRRYYR